MSKWALGQSGNPRQRPRRGRKFSAVARAIGQERVTFTDGSAEDGAQETAEYTRLERLARVLWTVSLNADLRAMRLLLEYIEGKPVQTVAATVKPGGVRTITADEMVQALAAAKAKVEAWQLQMGLGQPMGLGATSQGADQFRAALISTAPALQLPEQALPIQPTLWSVQGADEDESETPTSTLSG